MKLPFVKMHGAGNDYVYLDGFERDLPEDAPALARKLSDRHFSIGSDGLVYVLRGQELPARMRMWNADGSEAEMCGNAIRCVAKLLHERGHVRLETIPIETKAGPRPTTVSLDASGRVVKATVAMGIPKVGDEVELAVNGTKVRGIEVNVGNPHFVIFEAELTDARVNGLGPLLERHPRFPDRANIEFVKVVAKDRLRVRVWERGSNETLACGTGACAAFAAAKTKGETLARAMVALPGGELVCAWPDDAAPITLTGPCEIAFEGTVEV